MARPKSKGAYVPLAAQYYLDDAILEAGPDAELLFLRCLSFLGSVSTDGYITERQMRIVGLGLRGVPKRVGSLTKVGLFEAVDGGFVVRSWLKWNKSAAETDRLKRNDRERKAQKPGEDDPNSERNPDGFRTDSSPQLSTVQLSTELSSTKREPAKRGTRLSTDWLPSAESVAKAKIDAPDVNHKAEHVVFVDYWIAQPGQRGMKLDWDSTWRNWMRRKQGDLLPRQSAASTTSRYEVVS